MASVGFMPSGPRFAATKAVLRGCIFPPPQGGKREKKVWADRRTDALSDIAGDHDSKRQASTGGNFGVPHCSYFFSCSYSKRSSNAIRSLGLQVPSNRLDHRSTSPQFQTAIEYEYRPPRRTEYRFAEYEYDEIRCNNRKNPTDRVRGGDFTEVKNYRSSTLVQCFVRVSSRTRTQHRGTRTRTRFDLT